MLPSPILSTFEEEGGSGETTLYEAYGSSIFAGLVNCCSLVASGGGMLGYITKKELNINGNFYNKIFKSFYKNI